MSKWWDSPRVFGAAQAALSALIAIFFLKFPWNAAFGLVVIGLTVAYFRAASITDAQVASNAAEDADALNAARADIEAGNEVSERYYSDILSRVPLKDLERRALGLASDMSEITDKFLEDEYRLTTRLHLLNAMHDHPADLAELGYTREQVNDDLGHLELDAMKKYRDGGVAKKISEIVEEFAKENVHDLFLDSFEPSRAQEPYQIISFREALFRIVAKSSGAH
jgi:hypothetical protein